MKVTDTKFVQDYIAMAMHGDALGWHERNGGNFTYWLQDDEVRSIKEELTVSNEWLAIGTSVPYLANQYFLISGTGQFFHNMQKDPTHTIGIIQIDETGEKYQILWGLEAGGKPTSELPTHLMNMEVKAKQTKDANRVIYHCHCPNIIALTFILPLESEVFTRELWEIMTECPVIFPEGVGVVEWMVPGGKQIAIKTSQEMKEHGYNAVIWAHHGMFCSGTNFDQTFGLMHTIEKAAEIWLKVHSVVKVPRQSIPLQGLKDVGQAFGVKLNDSALYEK
ncbi:MAG: rhamnulose-1-phosphate aldolase [Absicoccus porci]|uniref:rhamnulose-1-phosphate aldolase n=1 Tax=Absicoccus porci TaxID=2486576 RepID=UPI002E7800B5|nr:rhamnulose-1-phosphate aldolase [Absicoccus porci]MEE1355869.1 rhamnulose-1-phosphate aldolase [Absicoccus porci]